MRGSLCGRYIHDDSETTADELHLKVTDGLNSVDVVLSIQVCFLSRQIMYNIINQHFWIWTLFVSVVYFESVISLVLSSGPADER